MASFFVAFAWVCGLSQLSVLLVGHFGDLLSLGISRSTHTLLGLGAAIANVSIHCLVFGIFTGSGKDVRLLVQDLGLKADFVSRAKRFKREVFPRALKAIFYILIAVALGGAHGAWGKAGSGMLYVAHIVFAWFSWAYGVRTMVVEAKSIRTNGELISAVNVDAEARNVPTESLGISHVENISAEQFGAHVFRLGKFLCFLGYNTWLLYFYLRYTMGKIEMLIWPYALVSLGLLLFGHYLKWKYQSYSAFSFPPQG